MHLKKIPAALLPVLIVLPASAQHIPQQSADCARVAEAKGRLACFDRLAAAHGAAPAAPASAAVPVGQPPGAFPARAQSDPAASLDGHWELNEQNRRGSFVFRPHQPNYLIATRSYRPNEAPYEAFRAADFTGKLSHGELAYQLGFKMKMVETAFELPVDLWRRRRGGPVLII